MSNRVTIKHTENLDFGIVQLRSDDILTFQPVLGLKTLTVDQLKEMLVTFNRITNGKSKLFFSDNTGLESLGFSERNFIGKNLHQFALASAVIENSSVIRFIGHNIQSMFPPKVPMRMFANKQGAIHWLKSL